MMSRKHYREMAHLLQRQKLRFKSPDDMMSFVTTICNFFSLDNPHFSSSKFIDAVYDEYYFVHPKDRPKPKQLPLMEPE